MLVGVNWLIDPIEIWEAPVFHGFNHIKPKQVLFLDICKPFQVWRHSPDVLYMGSSRVYIGIKPEEEAFNLGESAVTLPDIKAYLRFVYALHIPRKIYIGLDLYQFANESMIKNREGFSQNRLDILKSGNKLVFYFEALRSSLGTMRYLKETVQNSWLNRNKPKEWDKGYYVRKGEQPNLDGKSFYYHLNRFHYLYTNYTYDPDSIMCLKEILQDAYLHNVEVVLFFNPIPIDLIALQHICNREQTFKDIKINLAKVHPVYDFAWASSLSLNREKGWADGSHYRRIVGDKVRATLTCEVDSTICRVLNAETAETHLREEARLYKEWEVKNEEYVRVLADVAPQRIPYGTLEKYLGF